MKVLIFIWMKIIITENTLKHIIKELFVKDSNSHFQDRSIQRFFGQDSYEVVAIPNKDESQLKIIGDYKIPQEAKSKVKQILDFIEDDSIEDEIGTVFIIQLYKFVPTRNDVNFYGNNEKEIQDNKNLFNLIGNRNSQVKIYLREKLIDNTNIKTPQYRAAGYNLLCYARDNIIRTLFLEKATDQEILKRKAMRNYINTKKVIFINNPFTELEAYRNVDKLKNVKDNPQQQITPTIDDKERRLIAYKEKMKKNLHEDIQHKPKITQQIIQYLRTFNSDEELLRTGGVPTDFLDVAAFGFDDTLNHINPKQLNIKWKEDYQNVIDEVRNSHLSPIEWSKKIKLHEPIDVSYQNIGHGLKFYIEDGHHRYFAAKTLNKPLKMYLEIKANPITTLTPDLNYNEFHRTLWRTFHNTKTIS